LPVDGGACDRAEVVNSIAWGSTPNELGSTATAHYSNIAGGFPGVGNSNLDPLLVDPENDDYSLDHRSPCIDAGDPLSTTDPDGSIADMGALPYVWQPIGTNYCIANPNSSGMQATIGALGSDQVANDWLRLTASNLPINQFGYFLLSNTIGFDVGFGNSQGNLCLGAPLIRLNRAGFNEVVFSGTTGTAKIQPSLLSLPQGTVISPGETWYFQCWFRDVVGGSFTSNTTDGIAISWL